MVTTQPGRINSLTLPKSISNQLRELHGSLVTLSNLTAPPQIDFGRHLPVSNAQIKLAVSVLEQVKGRVGKIRASPQFKSAACDILRYSMGGIKSLDPFSAKSEIAGAKQFRSVSSSEAMMRIQGAAAKLLGVLDRLALIAQTKLPSAVALPAAHRRQPVSI